ncbi:hypothetical protein QTL97_09715 [Sporosarcina thermotolerans]|uniref:Uncharacterized protein n=1 Tax=Sporosarcina thermotolerans TaxID=633404 RepID=A0AAW9AAJ1_9BACL|nr:hypothetical protein [Sporosarcina thermotolerans]MDW0117214.1 hypothetical protein [Sporosarcina thermotolerans]WHT47385.1 hypothetical protein QNH10_14430 [Sporosarcina thermotolerans]
MSNSEVIILLLIYSGMLIFFLVPSAKRESKKVHKEQSTFPFVFKDNLAKMVFQKKAALALALFGVALFSIQSVFAGAEWHYNAHSGNPSISYKSSALFTMGGMIIYTAILLLILGYVRTIKSIKNAKQQSGAVTE